MNRSLLSFLIPAFILILQGCSSGEVKAPSADPPVPVTVHPAESITYRLPVRTTGLLATTREIKLSFKTGGIIREISVTEGRPVSRGDVLADLDLSEVRAQVRQAQIGLEKARRDMERAANLYRDSVATLEQYQNARSAFELAAAQKEIADFNLLHSQIKAPTDGTVMKILVEANELIGPGQPAILFASTENDWIVKAPLTDRDVVRLTPGDSVSVTMDAFPGMQFSGEISLLGSVADPVTGTYEAELRILESHPEFRTGFFARARIFPRQARTSLAVPLEALMEAVDRRALLYLYSDGKAERKRVVTGEVLDSLVVVEEGLAPGDPVIVDGARYLRPGSQVSVTNQSPGQP